jgi:hypothetical protein
MKDEARQTTATAPMSQPAQLGTVANEANQLEGE